MEKLEINKKLLPVKAHYFLLNGAHSGVITFIPVYAQQLGISSSAIGIILAVLSCLLVVSKTAFGGIADHFQKLKQLLLLLILIDVAADLGLNFIPKPYQAVVNTTSGNLFCHGGNSYIIGNNELGCKFDSENSSKQCSPVCSLCQKESLFCLEGDANFTTNESTNIIGSPNLKSTLDPSKIPMKCVRGNETKCTNSCFDGSAVCEDITGTNPPLQLWLLAFFVCLIYIANGSIVSLSDAACYNAISDQHQSFGRQRMFGTIGWASFALLSGYLNHVFTGSTNIYIYSAGFYMLVALFAVDLIFISKLQLQSTTLSKNICKDVSELLVKTKILAFILVTFGIGIVTGISRTYSFWYFRTVLGASQLILGSASAIQCFLGELPFFFFSGLIISKLGHANTFTMSFVAYGFRFLCYSFLTNPLWALPVEILQGPCFGSFYSAMTSYSKEISPEGTEATMQGIMSGTFEGLGVATGSLLAGFCMSKFGGRTTFYWIGIISLAAGVFHWLVHSFLNCNNTGKSTEKSSTS